MHPEKTRLVDFRRPGPKGRGGPRRGTFDLLGFTHFWGLSRKQRWTVKRKTARSRFSRTLKRLSERCRRNRHLPVKTQHEKLSQALRGDDADYGITGDWGALSRPRYQVRRIWRRWLGRRSHEGTMTWQKFKRLMKRCSLPPPRVVHTVYGRQLQFPFRA